MANFAYVVMNYWAVLWCGVVSMILGSIWYGPLFGKSWARMSGFSMADMKKAKAKGASGMWKSYLFMFIASLVMAYVMQFFMAILGFTSVPDGIQFSFWVWLGFIAVSQIGMVLWEGKPFRLYLIISGYYLLQMIVFSLIINYFR